jgi:propanol-preferring alcohol dehydrogenase
MPAYRLPGWGQELELAEVAIPTPRGRELLVEVQAVGLCHSDLFVMSCDEGVLPYDLPMTLGHEVAGRVVAGGDESDLSLVGRAGVVHGVWSCGECHSCRCDRGEYGVALEGRLGCGLGRDGGLAHYVLLPDARHFVVADGVPATVLAPLADAGLTSYHAIRTLDEALLGDSTVLLVGVGGLGHLAVQILRATTSADIIAVDPRPEARDLAVRLGAQRTAATIEEALAMVAGVDVVLDFVGSDETMRRAASGLLPGGRLVVVGGARGSMVVGKGLTLPLGWQVSAPFWGSRADLVAVVELAAKGLLEPVVEVVRFDDVPEAYQRLHDGGVTGRFVVAMDQEPG